MARRTFDFQGSRHLFWHKGVHRIFHMLYNRVVSAFVYVINFGKAFVGIIADGSVYERKDKAFRSINSSILKVAEALHLAKILQNET